MTREPQVLIAVDVETTGLNPESNEIVEIAAIKFVPGQGSVDTFHSLVRPAHPVPEEARRVHGISNQRLAGEPIIADVLPRFASWAGQTPIFAAHNARFDAGFIQHAASALGVSTQGWKIVDTLAWARQRIKQVENYKLGTLLQSIGFSPDSPLHRAMADAEGVVALVSHILSGYQDPIFATTRRILDFSKMADGRAQSRRHERKQGSQRQYGSQDPSSKQLHYLRYLGASEDELDGLDRWEASQLIDELKRDPQSDGDGMDGCLGTFVTMAVLVGIVALMYWWC